MTTKFGDKPAYPMGVATADIGEKLCSFDFEDGEGMTIRDHAEIAFIAGCCSDENVSIQKAVDYGMKTAKLWIEARESKEESQIDLSKLPKMIADKLFENRNASKPDRLAQVDIYNNQCGGGWGYKPIMDQIAESIEALKAEQKAEVEDGKD